MSSRKPRLLYVAHCYGQRGGTEEHTRALAEGLKDRYEISVVFPDPDPKEAHVVLVQNGRQVARYASKHVGVIAPYRAPHAEAVLSEVLKKTDPDLIHIQHALYWPLSVIDQTTAFGKPVVMSLHDYYVITPHYTMQGTLDCRQTTSSAYAKAISGSDISDYLIKRRKLLESSLAKVRHLIAPSKFAADQHRKIFLRDYTVIEHGIPPFEVLPRKETRGIPRFGCVGNLLPQKGWRVLLKAFDRVRKKFPDVELGFFGGGERPPDQEIPGVKFHGLYDQRDLPRFLAEFDVGVIPSIFAETYCLVLSELWMAGLPVAVSDIGALGERVHDGVNGKKFTAGDPKAVADALIWFLENASWRDWKIPRPRTVSEMIQDYDDLYRSLLTG